MVWYPCCGGEVCPCCSGSTPEQIQVTFTGIIDDDCAECERFMDDGPFICDWVGLNEATGYCEWEYTFPSELCIWEKIIIQLACDGTDWLNVVLFNEGGIGSLGFWQKSYSNPDCAALDDDIPRFLAYTSSECDLGTDPAHVTAL